MRYDLMETPIGPLFFSRDDEGINRVQFVDADKFMPDYSDWTQDRNDPLLKEAREQLAAYFAKKLKAFTLPLSVAGTEFQQRVWKALTDIPYGETWSYKDVAVHIGNPSASRAVGLANNKNKVSLLVP